MSPTSRPDDRGDSDSCGALRLPTTLLARHSLLALAASAAGVIGVLPGMPHLLSALLVIAFVAVGPGSAVLAWCRPLSVSKLFLVPLLGLAPVILVTTAAAEVGWWSPHAVFAMLALATTWSVIPNVTAVVRDMVP